MTNKASSNTITSAEVRELPGGQLLLWEAHDAALAQRAQHLPVCIARQGLRQVQALDRRAEGVPAVRHFHVFGLKKNGQDLLDPKVARFSLFVPSYLYFVPR